MMSHGMGLTTALTGKPIWRANILANCLQVNFVLCASAVASLPRC
jgi:hypothetical protein